MRRHWIALLFGLAAFAGGAVPVSAQTFRTNVGAGNQVLDAANECATIDLSGTGTLGIQVEGVYSGTVTWTVAVGDTFVAIDLFAPDTPSTAANSTTSTGVWTGAAAGLTKARACMTSYTSGAARVTLAAVGTGGGGGGGGAGGSAALALQSDDDGSIPSGTTGIDTVINFQHYWNGTNAWLPWQGAVTVSSLPALAAGNNNIGDVDVQFGGSVVSFTNPLAICLSDLSSACVPVTADPADEGTFTYTTTKVTPFGAVAESTTDAITDGKVGGVVMTLLRQLRTVPTGYSAGGGTPIQVISTGSAQDEHAVCTADCTIYSITATNHASVGAFLRCENDTTGNTTPGSETASANEPDLEIPGDTSGRGITVTFPVGLSYATALTCWIVTNEAASGTTSVGADDVRVLYSRVQ